MHAEIAQRKEELIALCRRYDVARLEVFGSAARAADFNSAASDVDFLVEFRGESQLHPLEQFFGLSGDWWHGQRIGDALAVEIDEGVMHGLVERGDVCEGPVGE